MSLCWRCENRAVGHETGHGPRYECTDFAHSKVACYCYQPVKPVILKRLMGDRRPQFGPWQFSARSQYAGVPDDLMLKIEDYGRKGKAAIWVKTKK